MAWNDKRPMSPHLQIYDLPTTARLSILHRITGAILMGGLLLVVVSLAVAAGGETSWDNYRGLLFGWFGKLVLFGFTLVMYYHLCTGLRHLWWDLGRGLELSDNVKSTKLVLGTSAALTVITWLIALG